MQKLRLMSSMQLEHQPSKMEPENSNAEVMRILGDLSEIEGMIEEIRVMIAK